MKIIIREFLVSFILLLLSICIVNTCLGAETKETNPSVWHFTVEAMANAATGNNNYTQYAGKFNAVRKSQTDKLTFKLAYNNQRTKGDTIESKTSLETNYNYKWDSFIKLLDLDTDWKSKKVFLFSDSRITRDRVRNAEFQAESFYGAGYKHKRSGHDVDVQAGLGFDFQDAGEFGERVNPEVRLATNYAFRLSKRLKMTYKAEYDFRMADPSKFTFDTGIGFETKVTRRLTWKVGTELMYESNPMGDVKKTDTLSSVSFIVRF